MLRIVNRGMNALPISRQSLHPPWSTSSSQSMQHVMDPALQADPYEGTNGTKRKSEEGHAQQRAKRNRYISIAWYATDRDLYTPRWRRRGSY